MLLRPTYVITISRKKVWHLFPNKEFHFYVMACKDYNFNAYKYSKKIHSQSSLWFQLLQISLSLKTLSITSKIRIIGIFLILWRQRRLIDTTEAWIQPFRPNFIIVDRKFLELNLLKKQHKHVDLLWPSAIWYNVVCQVVTYVLEEYTSSVVRVYLEKSVVCSSKILLYPEEQAVCSS
jgi:hypothetical protein